MGLGGISIWQLLIILVIVVLLFGTKKLRTLGGDLGSAIKNFKDSMREGEQSVEQEKENTLHHDAEQTASNKAEKDKHTS